MATEMALRLFCLAWLVMCMGVPCYGVRVFDVTKFGANHNGKTDNTKAFSDAWNAACAHGGAARFLIPEGTFLVGPIMFLGPCFNRTSPSIEIKGKVLAPSSPNSIPTIGWIEFRSLNKLVVGGGGVVDGQGADTWKQKISKPLHSKQPPLTFRFIKITNATIANLTLLDSKGFHMAIQRSNFITVRNLNISAPGGSPNTDGIHISDASNVNITGLTIGTGDDCISVGPGNINISISGVTCGPGHGISVGGLGKYMDDKDVIGVKVKDCTISNTQNGIRIKTWPGSPSGRASNFTFENIRVHNVSHPIIIDQHYCPKTSCSNKPSLIKVNNVRFKGISGTYNLPIAVSLNCSKSVPCENVQLHDINLRHIAGKAVNLSSVCSNVKGLVTGSMKVDELLTSLANFM